MKKTLCTDCGRELKKDEIALNKKIINTDAKEYMCLTCMSDFLGCSEEDLIVKIEEFKEQGCTLFI